MGKRAKWRDFTRQEIEKFVQESFSWATLAEKLGYDKYGGSYLKSMKTMAEELNLDVSHFTGQRWLFGQTYVSSLYIPFNEYVERDCVQTN